MGIRKRGWEATPLLPLNNTEDKISIRRDDNSKLISNTSTNKINKYSTNYSNNPKSTNSYISGSSQSNYIYQRSYGTDNKNDKINISSNTKNISNSNQLRSPIIKHNYSSQKLHHLYLVMLQKIIQLLQYIQLLTKKTSLNHLL